MRQNNPLNRLICEFLTCAVWIFDKSNFFFHYWFPVSSRVTAYGESLPYRDDRRRCLFFFLFFPLVTHYYIISYTDLFFFLIKKKNSFIIKKKKERKKKENSLQTHTHTYLCTRLYSLYDAFDLMAFFPSSLRVFIIFFFFMFFCRTTVSLQHHAKFVVLLLSLDRSAKVRAQYAFVYITLYRFILDYMFSYVRIL